MEALEKFRHYQEQQTKNLEEIRNILFALERKVDQVIVDDKNAMQNEVREEFKTFINDISLKQYDLAEKGENPNYIKMLEKLGLTIQTSFAGVEVELDYENHKNVLLSEAISKNLAYKIKDRNDYVENLMLENIVKDNLNAQIEDAIQKQLANNNQLLASEISLELGVLKPEEIEYLEKQGFKIDEMRDGYDNVEKTYIKVKR